jgi:hypothetical protein
VRGDKPPFPSRRPLSIAFAISLAYLDRLQLRKDLRPEQWCEVLIEQIAIAFMGFRRNVRLDVRAAVEAGEQEITELHAKLHAAHDRVNAPMAR